MTRTHFPENRYLIANRRPFAVALLAVSGALAAHTAAAFECLVEPTQQVEIRSPIVGTLEQVTVRRGDRVKKGQVLVALESRAERASADLAKYKATLQGPVQEATAKLDYAKRKAERRRQMQKENLMSTQDAEDAEGDMKIAEAELLVARENKEIARLESEEQNGLLGRRTILSPFDGVVADQLLYPGEVVDPNDPKKPILKLVQIDPLRVHVILPRAVFGKIRKGMTGEVTPEAPAQGAVKGTVRIVDAVVDAASGTFGAFLEVPNPKLEIPAGLRCTAKFAGISEKGT
jgi:RND family efflux transporter MFP subunit